MATATQNGPPPAAPAYTAPPDWIPQPADQDQTPAQPTAQPTPAPTPAPAAPAPTPAATPQQPSQQPSQQPAQQPTQQPTQQPAKEQPAKGFTAPATDQPSDFGGSQFTNFTAPASDQPTDQQDPNKPFVSNETPLPATDDQLNSLDTPTLIKRLTEYGDVDSGHAATILHDRLQQDAQTATPQAGGAMLANDLSNTLSKISVNPVDWAKGLVGFKNTLGGAADTVMQSLGRQNTGDYRADLQQQLKQQTITKDQFDQGNALLNQIDEIQAKRAMLGPGGGLGETAEHEQELGDEQSNITRMFFQADPTFAKTQASKALATTLTGTEHSIQDIAAIPQHIADFDPLKYMTGASKMTGWSTDDIKDWINTERFFNVQRLQHAQGQVDPWSQAMTKWGGDFAKRAGLWNPESEVSSPQQVDPAKVGEISQTAQALEMSALGELAPVGEIAGGVSAAGLKTLGLGLKVLPPVARFAEKAFTTPVGRFITSPIQLALAYPELIHGNIGGLAWDAARDGIMYGGLHVLDKYGPLASEMLERAADNNFKGGGFLSQGLSRGIRLGADAVTNSFPYALLTSGGDPGQFWNNLTTLSAFHGAARAPETALNTLAGGTGDWLFARDGKVKTVPPKPFADDPDLSNENISNIQSLDPHLQNIVTRTQAAAGDHTDLFIVSPQTMQEYQGRFGATAQQTPRGFWVPPEYTGTGRSAAFIDVNHVNDALPHEAMGHPLYWLMSQADRDAVSDAAIKENDPDQFIKDNYGQNVTYDSLPQSSTTPGQLSKDMIRTEMGVESIGNYWNGGSIEQFYKDKPGLARALRYGSGKIMERLGIPTSTWESQTTMGINPAFAPSTLIDGYYRDLLNHRIIRQNVPTNSLGRWPQRGETVTPGGAQPGGQPPPGQGPGGGPPPGGPTGGPQPTGGPGSPQPATGFAAAKPANVLSVTKPAAPTKALPPPTPPEPEHPAAADTDEAHEAIEAAAEKGTPVGEAQAAAAGQRPQTLRETGEEPGYLIAGKRQGPPPTPPIWNPLATAAGVGTAHKLPPPAPGETPAPRAELVSQPQAQAPAQTPTKTPSTPPEAPAPTVVGKTPAEPQKPVQQAPKAAKQAPATSTGPMSDQETLQRSMIVNRLEAQTGEKDIHLDDPRVTAALGGTAPAKTQQPQQTQQPAAQQPQAGNTATSRSLRATWFGRNPDGSVDTTDEGRMSYYDAHHGAWGADLLDPKLKGVALSKDFLVANGIDPKKSPGSQGYRVRVTAPNGKSEVTDIVDVGPGNTVDMTYGLGKDLGLSDNSQLKVELLDNQGKTVTLRDKEGGKGGGGGGGGQTAGGGLPIAGSAGTPYTPPTPQPAQKLGAEVPAMNIEPQPFVGAGGESGGGGASGRWEGGGQAPMQMPRQPPMTSPAMQAAEFEAYSGSGTSTGTMVPGAPGQSVFMPSFMPAKGKRGAEEPEEESTLGEPMPKGMDKLLPQLGQGLTGLKQAQVQHAKLLSPDDTRVRQQGSGPSTRFKGEHFVQGDPVHAAALADVPDQEKTVLAAGQTAIANRKPMHMTYLSAPPARETPISRQSRTVDYDESSPEARLMGSTRGQLAGHSVIPLSVGISTPRKKGEPNRGYIEGISTSAAAHNHALINEALGMMGEPSPYPEMRTPKFRNDLRGYIQNLQAGHTGTGNKYQVGTEDYPVKPDKDYVPYRLKQREADFMNAILNNQRARTTPAVRELARKGGTLLSEEGEVNPMRQSIDQEEIKDPQLKHAANERWSKHILEPTIRTFKAGLVKSLHEDPGSIPADLRENVAAYRKLTETLSKEMGQKKGWPDIPTAAGFMPRKPAPLSPEEHQELTGNIRKQFLSGKLRQADYLERLQDVPEPGQEIAPGFMPMAGPKAQGFKVAKALGKTFETPLPGGGKRFEIDDRDMEFKPASPNAKPIQMAVNTRPPKNALEERYNTDTRGPGKMPLSDAIRHPELFENYPFLRRTQISMDPTIRHSGHYEPPYIDENGNPKGDHIVLNDPESKETLAHEIQHAVQTYENFSGQGTNSSHLAGLIKNDTGVRDELEKVWDAAYPGRNDMSNDEFAANEELRKKWTAKRVKEMAFAMYHSEPGEIEARVAGQRAMHPTDEEREQYIKERELPPYERITPQQNLTYEMQDAEREARAAGTMNPSYGPYPYKPSGTPPRSAAEDIGFMAAKKGAPPPTEKFQKPKNWDTQPENVRQAYLEEKVARTKANSYKGKETHPLEEDRDEKGAIKYDPNGNPIYKKRDYNIVNSPLLKKKGLDQLEGADEHPDEIDPNQHTHLNFTERRRLSAMRKASAVSTMGDKILESYMGIKDKPAIMAGKGWYSRMREKLAGALGEHHELFAQLLGATSAKTPVRNNFIQALDALEQFKSGAFDRHKEKYLEAYQKLKEGGKDALVAHMKEQGIPLFTLDSKGNRTDVEDHDTDASAMANWIAHHGIMPKQKLQPGQTVGAKYNANSLAVLRAIAGTWLHEVDAPKTPNFAGNLTGRTLEATIDVWAARHLQRLGYEGQTKGKPWRSLAQAEPGVSGLDFAFSQDAMRDAAEKITKATGEQMNPDDLQAILWFAEKHHYEEKGWTRGAGAAKSSFDDVADLAFPKSGKPMTSEDLRSHYEKIRLAKDGLHYEHHPKEFMRKRWQPYLEKHGIQSHHIEAAKAEAAEEAGGLPEEEEEAA